MFLALVWNCGQKKEWDKTLTRINALTRFSRENAKMVRAFLAGVKQVDLDGTGRINIPNDLIIFAGIQKNSCNCFTDQHYRNLGQVKIRRGGFDS